METTQLSRKIARSAGLVIAGLGIGYSISCHCTLRFSPERRDALCREDSCGAAVCVSPERKSG